jgi:nicotinamidase/pyrazinamidase
MKFRRALLVVDVQKDFCPRGALGVQGGDKIIPALNRYIEYFRKNKFPIFLSRDWHPKKTKHFDKFGGPWPAHCIADTKGAEFHAKLKIPKEGFLIYKGMDPDKDSYSAFHAEDKYRNSLGNLLKILKVEELYIGGLATDYCVRFSTRDAIKQGYKVRILTDAIKGVDLNPGDSKKTLNEMREEGATMITFKDLK